jgi:hypothetical protein
MAQGAVVRGESIDAQIKEFGDRSVKEIQARMDEGIAPGLQQETIDKKHRTGSKTPETPLEDTHRLRNSISWVRRG